MTELEDLHRRIRACRICAGAENPLPHEPNPVVVLSTSARIAICGQAPGNLVNQTGIPFNDPSGDRLRDWLQVTREQFYDPARFAIVPMGFCFPGLDRHGGDLPPRRECGRTWHAEIFRTMPQIELKLLIGGYAQKWHLGKAAQTSVTGTVRSWRSYFGEPSSGVKCLPLPHPSWRNTAWLKKNPWFADELLPVLRAEVHRLLD